MVGESQLVAALSGIQHPLGIKVEEVRAVIPVVHLAPESVEQGSCAIM